MKNKIIPVILFYGSVSGFIFSCSTSMNTDKKAAADSTAAVADITSATNPPIAVVNEPVKDGPLWKELSTADDTAKVHFKSYKLFALDSLKIQKLLAQAPLEKDRNTESLKTILEIPRPDGGYMKFRIYRTTTMAPELEAQYPLLKTYGGQGIDDRTAHARLDFNQNGFHAYVISQAGEWFVEPRMRGITHQYLYCFFKRDVIIKNRKPFEVPDSIRR